MLIVLRNVLFKYVFDSTITHITILGATKKNTKTFVLYLGTILFQNIFDSLSKYILIMIVLFPTIKMNKEII